MRFIILFGIFVYASRTQSIEPINENMFVFCFLVVTIYAIVFDLMDALKK